MTVTEASPNITEDPQVTNIISNLRDISAKVKIIDDELGSEDQGPVARRNKLASDLVEKFTSDENYAAFMARFGNVVEAIQKSFSSDPNVLAAIYTDIHNQLGSKFGKTVKTHLDKEVAAQPTSDTPTIPVERKEELINTRSKLVGIFKTYAEMLKFYDVLELPTDIDVPSGRKGAIGPRGASFTGEYAFYIGDEDKPRTVSMKDKAGNKIRQNVNLSQIASTVCKDLQWKTKQLKDFIVSELSLEITGATDKSPGSVDPGPSFEIMLPTVPEPTKLRGVKVDSSAPVVDDSDDDDDDDDDNDVQDSNDDDMFAGAQS